MITSHMFNSISVSYITLIKHISSYNKICCRSGNTYCFVVLPESCVGFVKIAFWQTMLANKE